MYPNIAFPTNLQSLQGLRVLVADNNADSCYLITMLLQLYGIEVLTASLAQQALEIFMQWQPDVIVSDTALLNNDNYELIQEVRTNAGEHGKVVIAIALTDYDHQNICDGFDMQFTKPLDIHEFVAELACLTIS